MGSLRISSVRANYVRGGLHFRETAPEVKRLVDGRLAFVLTDTGIALLGEANLALLRSDPNIRVEEVGTDGVTDAERAIAAKAQGAQAAMIERLKASGEKRATEQAATERKRMAALRRANKKNNL